MTTIVDPGLTLAHQIAARPEAPTTRRRPSCHPRCSSPPPRVERRAAGNPTAPRPGSRRRDPIGTAEFFIVLAVSLCPPALLAWGIAKGAGK